jgi:hypothetical protein
LGYDYGINYCPNGTYSNDCRLSNKPIRWDYLNDARRRSVYNTYSKLNALRANPYFKDAFLAGTPTRDLGGAFKWLRLAADTSQVMVVGNFGLIPATGTVTFPTAGSWYEYLNNNAPFSASSGPQNITLQPGEFHVYINRNTQTGVITALPNVPIGGAVLEARAYPNPTKGDFTVAVSVPQSASTSFELLGAGGQYIGLLKQSFLVKGSHQVTLQRKGLATGTYYLRITNKANNKIIPIVLQ